ncbi:MAG: hypothetical protein JXR37_14995 [Kiritimatiellae bacterium]|nr:hypothetical protein [Kiritimatiellia bacterium]
MPTIPAVTRSWLFGLLLAAGAGGAEPAGTLIFRTGFERETIGKPAGCHNDIVGADKSVPAPNDWEKDLEGHPLIGKFVIQFSKGNADDRRARIVDDPTGAGRGRVLEFWMKNALQPTSGTHLKGRIQVNMTKCSPAFNEMTSRMKLFLHPNFRVLEQMEQRLTWLTLKEYWTNPDWGQNLPHFRISLGLAKKAGVGERLYWHLDSTRTVRHALYWRTDTHDRRIWVPIGEWFTLTVYYRQGDAASGRFRIRITYADGREQELFDVTNWTMSPDNPDEQTGMAFWNPMKLYAHEKTFSYIRDNAGPATVYWDDWELYQGDAYSR